MIAPENPPSFVVRTDAGKAAWDNGFRLEGGIKDGWLHFASTTARVVIWIARASKDGPWLLAVDRPEVAEEMGISSVADLHGPGVGSFAFDTLHALYGALDRVYRLGVSLPDAPLREFQAAASNLPRTTEAERLVVQRVGQEIFRKALLVYWDGRCPLTGITDEALLRASHIVPWAKCQTDEQRLDVHNGLLLSALWDAAFDAGLVSFTNDGTVLPSPHLTSAAATALGLKSTDTHISLTDAHRANLAWHRSHHAF